MSGRAGDAQGAGEAGGGGRRVKPALAYYRRAH